MNAHGAAYFITATGTGIGKTLVTAALCHQLRQQREPVRVLKPLISGWQTEHPKENDTLVLLHAEGKQYTQEHIDATSPWRFTAPLAPPMAAKREGRMIDFQKVIGFCQQERLHTHGTLLIEGAGGVMSPITERHTCLDWAKALQIPVILVAGSYLGSISHTLSAVTALRARQVPVQAIIVSESAESTVDLAETVESVNSFTGLRVITLPRLAPRHGEPWEHAPDLLVAYS